MFSIKRTGTAALLGGAMAICGISAAYATPSVSTSTIILFGNNSDPSNPGNYADTVIDPHDSSTGAPVSSSFSGDFSGQNASGAAQTMHVQASGQASAEFGDLHASSTLHLSTPFANTAANAPYTKADYSADPNGIPDSFSVIANAVFKDTLSLDASSSVSTLRLSFHLDGTITDNNLSTAMSSAINVFDSNDPSHHYYLSLTPGAVDTTVNVDLDVTDPSAIDLALTLSASSGVFLDIGGYSDSSDYVIDANFYNTLELTGIEGFDANGGQIALNSVSGASGTNYLALVAPPPATGAPEPATLVLFGAGLAGLRLRKRKSSK